MPSESDPADDGLGGVPAPAPLLTPRLSLRRWTRADVPDLLDLDDDPDVVRFVGGPEPRGEREARWRAREPKDVPKMVVRERESGAFVGWVYVAPFPSRPGQWELGYRLRKEHWGKGYAAEAAAPLLEWAWTRPEIDAVFAAYDPSHAASRRVMLKLGMEDGDGVVEYPEEDNAAFPYCLIRRPDAVEKGAAS
ncbi:acyl-CoA N-acyltransferase [Hyaloraphidium curvatum]|nr:acyl-CoA N-acyltransferase [Hyaloraphidium curvatum]